MAPAEGSHGGGGQRAPSVGLADEAATAIGQGCRIAVVTAFRVATLTIREDLLVSVRRGRKTLVADEESLVCPAGQGLLVARGTQWDVINDPAGHARYEALVLSFGEAIVREHHALHAASLNSQAIADARCVPMDDEVHEAMVRASSFLRAKAVSTVVRRHRMLEVLLLLAERGHHFTPIEDLSWEARVRRQVAQRPAAAWSVEALAESFHCSVSTLRRRLDAEGVVPLATLVREVRLELALHWLQTTRQPIGGIAQRCGWASHSRFSAAFQERWGFSPSALRSTAGGGE